MGWLIYGALAYAAYKLVQNVTRAGAKPAERARVRQGAPPAEGPRSPWQVLEIAPGATRDEIRHAYQAKVQQYHPDRIAHAALELRQLAEQRTKEINAAYQQLKGQGRDEPPSTRGTAP